MTTKKIYPNRRVVATLYRGRSMEVVWTRHFAYFDTAMPRAVQLCMNYGNRGDFVEFHSLELGYQIGILRIQAGGKIKLELSPLIKHSPSLLKLMSADPPEVRKKKKKDAQ